MGWWRNGKYKNLIIFFVGIVFALALSRLEIFHEFLLNLGGFGYLSAFFAGTLFVSTFTVATGIVILLVLAEILSPLEIGLIAGFGAVLGDFTILQLVKRGATEELKEFYEYINNHHYLAKILHSKYFHWTLLIIGAAIIASPLPDELGVTLLGISKMKTYQFLIVSFILNAIGIFLVISASLIIKP